MSLPISTSDSKSSSSSISYSSYQKVKMDEADNKSSLLNSMTDSDSSNTVSKMLNTSSSMSDLTSAVLGSGSGDSFLSDYASIKNGSYNKLLKAYYKELSSSGSSASGSSSTGSATAAASGTTASTGTAASGTAASSADTQYTSSGAATTTISDLVSSIFNATV